MPGTANASAILFVMRPKLTQTDAIWPPMKATSQFFCLTDLGEPTEIRQPEDIIPFLGKPELHWKPGYSACELARSWVRADGIPKLVRAVLDTSDVYAGAELIEGIFERKVRLRSRGAPSQTDLMALLETPKGRRLVAVEGKVEEPFGPLVKDWHNGSFGKTCRLKELCGILGLAPDAVNDLRYQLLHRAVSAVYEAERCGVGDALLLVHSFSRSNTSFDDFARFAETIGCPVEIGRVSSDARMCGTIALRLGWVADRPLSA